MGMPNSHHRGDTDGARSRGVPAGGGGFNQGVGSRKWAISQGRRRFKFKIPKKRQNPEIPHAPPWSAATFCRMRPFSLRKSRHSSRSSTPDECVRCRRGVVRAPPNEKRSSRGKLAAPTLDDPKPERRRLDPHRRGMAISGSGMSKRVQEAGPIRFKAATCVGERRPSRSLSVQSARDDPPAFDRGKAVSRIAGPRYRLPETISPPSAGRDSSGSAAVVLSVANRSSPDVEIRSRAYSKAVFRAAPNIPVRGWETDGPGNGPDPGPSHLGNVVHDQHVVAVGANCSQPVPPHVRCFLRTRQGPVLR